MIKITGVTVGTAADDGQTDVTIQLYSRATPFEHGWTEAVDVKVVNAEGVPVKETAFTAGLDTQRHTWPLALSTGSYVAVATLDGSQPS
jgi:hypothetical protein